MKCANCGNENSSNAKFCRGCGSKCSASEPSSQPKISACQKCGHENAPGKKFCPKCGTPTAPVPILESNAQAAQAVVPPSVATIAITNAVATPPTPTPTSTVPSPTGSYASQSSNDAQVQSNVSPHSAGAPYAAAKNMRLHLAGGAAIAVVLLSSLGGGYWFYQKQEAEKAIALKKQQDEEIRQKAIAESMAAAEARRAAAAEAKRMAAAEAKRMADAKAEENRLLSARVARLEAEKRALADQQRAQAQLQYHREELERQRRAMRPSDRTQSNTMASISQGTTRTCESLSGTIYQLQCKLQGASRWFACTKPDGKTWDNEKCPVNR